ncbi:MAG: hypothetical protein IJY65_00560 [Clostridia bacterium]|nr:hypothetical protein [Clostridia bacterium]
MKIGFLPLYIKLYDDATPWGRPRFEAFYTELTKILEERGVSVVTSPFCRLADEFDATVKRFEREEVDAIVTLHMAYSPSLESIDALSATKLPLVVMDTTSTFEFDNLQDPTEVHYCHGIHGVMDMCSMLIRRGKEFAIAAGHYTESDVIDRTLGYVRAAIAAKALGKARVARIGGPFEGMGDFVVPVEEMKERFGIEAFDIDKEKMQSYASAVTTEEVEAERCENAARFDFADNVIKEEYDATLRASLTMRKCIEGEGLSAFTATFLGMGSEQCGLEVMPFIESCKAMERGVGYAGEGDTLTAAFTGAFLQGYPETTFCEIFCPDWKNSMVMLSHMGEVNYRIADTKPVVTRVGTNYAPTPFPVVGYTRMKGGRGVYVNICRAKDDFKLVIFETEMVSYDKDNFPTSMRGWMKTGRSCADFLENLSINGATHHSTFVYGATAEEIKFFAKLIGVEATEI